jgi:PAS domain S-box-containing protein
MAREPHATTLRELRQKIWSMRSRDDIGDLLVAVHGGLRAMGVPFVAYSINILDDPADRSMARAHVHHLDDEGKWVENSADEAEAILQFYRAGTYTYRRDLEREDPYGERARIYNHFDKPVRCILDVPFAYGTIAVNSTEANAFSDAHISALVSLAEVLSEGFGRLQDLEEIARHQSELKNEVAGREQAEVSLRHSQVRFDNLVDNLAAGLLVTDLADEILFTNERMAAMTGYSVDELIGQTAYELLLDPEYWPMLAEQNKQRANGITGRYETQVRHRDGRFFWIEAVAGPYRDPDGVIVGTVATVTDITERKQTAADLIAANAELQRREALIQAFQSIGYTSLSTLDLDRILKDLAEQIITAGFFRSLMIALVDHEARRVHVMRSFVNLHDEEKGWQRGTIDPSQDKKVQGISYDLDHDDNITAQVAREGKLKVLVDWNENYDARLDNKGSTAGKVAYFIPVKKGDDVLAVLATGSTVDEQERTLQNIEIMQPLLQQAAVALEHARLYKQLQRAKVEAEEARRAAEAANHAKGQFLANMSHEIRTPMNAVIGMTELAMDTELDATQREYLEIVKSSANSLLQVIDDILDFSKVEAGKLAIESTVFSLREVVTSAVGALAARAREKKIALNHSIDGTIAAELLGDPLRLRQILINLLGNAIKFTETGTVELRVALEENGGDGSLLRFAISDTGIGITKDKQSQIFDAFTQADASTTRRYGGTGLGLAICSRLVQLMGGRIWVESEVGRGSTFSFTARFAAYMQSRASDVAPAAPIDAVPLFLLLAEDNAFNQRVAVGLLEKKGHRVEVVGDGRGAVDLSARHSFDAILMDVQMPEMDGLQATRMIRQREAESGSARQPIIGLTAHAMQGDRERCLEAGMDGYVAKPIQPAVLYAALAESTANVASRSSYTPEVAKAAAANSLDLSAALERCDGDEELLIDLIAIFREDWPGYLQRMDADIESAESGALSRSAHAIKSPLASLGLQVALVVAVELEQMGKDGQLDAAGQRLAVLRRELERVDPLLALWRGEGQ